MLVELIKSAGGGVDYSDFELVRATKNGGSNTLTIPTKKKAKWFYATYRNDSRGMTYVKQGTVEGLQFWTEPSSTGNPFTKTDFFPMTITFNDNSIVTEAFTLGSSAAVFSVFVSYSEPSSGGGSTPFSHYAEGDFYQNGNTPVPIDIGFEAKVIVICKYNQIPLESDADGTMYWVAGTSKAATNYNNTWQIGALGSRFTISDVTSTGFKYTAYSGNTNRMRYVAFG